MTPKLEGTFIVYDRQGALAAHIKNHFKHTKLEIYHIKETETFSILMDGIDLKKILFVVFIFPYESDLMNAVFFTSKKIPVIYAPTNKIVYQTLKKIKGIEVMNIVQSKYNYSKEIIRLIGHYKRRYHD